MINLFRQLASTAMAVAIVSAFPLAQAPAPPPAGDETPSATRQAAGASAPIPAPAAPAGRVAATANASQTRDQLRELLDRHPPSLWGVFRLDPTLLGNAEYLAPYPELAEFLAQHPEVEHNPAFYIGTAHDAPWERNPSVAAMRMWEEVLQGLMILTILSLVTGVLVWVVRTIVDYRRWLRLTRVQSDTHTKLLDRLTNQEDLLAYMQTPAGRRFLESAPIALDAASRPLGAPLSRVLWSVQAGVVIGVVGIGVLLVSRSAIPEVGEGLRVIGILAVALGAGFVLSAAIAYGLSSRMGLFDQRAPTPGDALGTAALPRGRD